jgi:polar amino acid transport system permease protein
LTASEILWQNVQPLFGALPVTLEVLGLLLVVGLTLGVVLAFAQTYGRRPLRYLCVGYEQLFRGIPPLVVLLLYWGLLQKYGTPRILVAALALGMRSAAYQSQIFRGAIQAVAPGQMMAARSLGMSKVQAIVRVILPQAFRLAIPPWANEYSSVVKDTAFICVIGGLIDLTRQALMKVAPLSMRRPVGTQLILPYLIILGLFYLVLTYAGNGLLALLERRLRLPGFEMKGKVER